MNLLVELDGATVPLNRCDYVLWQPCGCPRGVTLAGAGDVVTEDDAWREFFPRKRDRERAQRSGLRMELMTHERWRNEVSDLMRKGCPHQKEQADG